VKTISKMLRHADIATTLRIYAKATDKLMSEAAGKLDNAITTAMRKAPRVS
jgi:integrase